MKTNRKTDLAIQLVSQAFVLDRMGTAGLDVAKLVTLLRAAARSLDSKVGDITIGAHR